MNAISNTGWYMPIGVPFRQEINSTPFSGGAQVFIFGRNGCGERMDFGSVDDDNPFFFQLRNGGSAADGISHQIDIFESVEKQKRRNIVYVIE